jgi:hypothetical protein
MNEEDHKELQGNLQPEYDIKEESNVLKQSQLEEAQIFSYFLVEKEESNTIMQRQCGFG